jgi:hypothetical protein
MDLSKVEVPRLVKKPGEHKRVNTMAELEAALSDGWVLRLPTVPAEPVAEDAPADVDVTDTWGSDDAPSRGRASKKR